MKYWELIAHNLSKAGWSWGCISAVDSDACQANSDLEIRRRLTRQIPRSFLKTLPLVTSDSLQRTTHVG